MTIRAKLYIAILLTILGPVVTIAVALHGMQRLGDRFDEVQQRADQRALALDLKFGVTDFNGWQTAYGYDNGASRPRFIASVREFRRDLRSRARVLTDPQERAFCDEISARFEQFMALDDVAFAALQRGDDERVKQIFLGPELRLFDAMATRAEDLASYESRRESATETTFDDTREDSRRGLIAVALGAALVIILLLVTASDIARMALEGGRETREAEPSDRRRLTHTQPPPHGRAAGPLHREPDPHPGDPRAGGVRCGVRPVRHSMSSTFPSSHSAPSSCSRWACR